MIAYTYKLTMNNSLAYYIGVTKDQRARYASHKCDLQHGRHGSHMFQKAWDESQSTMLAMEILFEGDVQMAALKEVELLIRNSKDLNFKNTCVRSAKGVELDRLENPESFLLKKSLASSGEKNPMYGKTHTPEAREKISKHLKGLKLGVLKGPRPEEFKAKMREHRRLNPLTGDKNPFFGRTHTEQTRLLLKAKNAGKLPPNTMKVIIDGKVYDSQKEAGKHLGVSGSLIGYRLKHPNKYPNYKSFI